ncbi:MAG TPA: transferrin receptor-like dimerization domain-containing protein [Bryobacteraceae bacterium]|jgi:N-acetylated-alpha-linked acidic dipeptidase
MRRAWALLAVVVPLLSQQAIAPIRGFPSEDWKAEHALEDKAKTIPAPARIHIYMERIASKPHQAGSPESKAVAEYLAAQLKDWGLEVHTEQFEALMPYPTSRLLEMTSPVKFRAELKEPAIPEDSGASEPGQLPTYNAYSASGDVTAPLVYVNYGIAEDYDTLRRENIEVKGKIAIARYGRSWRGVKAKLAQENGAVGCLIYSDPREDGYFQGDVYPKGPMRPELGVQRGSVLDMALYPGDPLSPGWAAEPGARRLPLAEAKTLMKIPVLPISYGDAKPLLEQLGGMVVPESWRGALPITYHSGPGPAIVHLKLDFDWSTKPLHDVFATIPGAFSKDPQRDQWIIYGNHHDAWVNGASDPASGAAVLMETARTLSVLRREGWQPKRTIVFALWDGEEFGLMGSTEWTEKHLKDLQAKAVVYLNSDNTGRGALSAGGSHSLEAFLAEVLRDISEPVGTHTLLDAAKLNSTATQRARSGQPGGAPEFHLLPLGSGSDYVPFLDHAGVASMNLGFAGGDAGVYHSIYDTLGWFDRFSDGSLVYGKALSQVMTMSILRLAGAPVLPFEFGSLERTVRGYTEDLQKLATQAQQKRPGSLDLRGVQLQLMRLDAASRAYEEQLALVTRRALPGSADRSAPSADRFTKANEALQKAEGTLLSAGGLPGREWYQHQLYAPGLYTGYDAKTMPGVREAVEAGRWDEANEQARHVAQALRALTSQVEEATRLLK